MRLYHGSDIEVRKPIIAYNTGFADLGQGFYLTDNRDVACQRARSRARRLGARDGVVSVFEFDEGCVPWACWGACGLSLRTPDGGVPFGLCFDEDREGIAAWVSYIRACRRGQTGVGDLGAPAVVRAWIATEEVEMVCAGFATAEDLAEFIDPRQLVTQFCFADQGVIDGHLSFVGAENVRL